MRKNTYLYLFLLLIYFGVVLVTINSAKTAQAQTVQLWSDPTAWGGSVPANNTAVIVPAGKTILLDVNINPKSLQIDGTLIFDNKDLAISADWIMVHGRLQIGSATAPYLHKAVITLTGSNPAENVMGMGTKFLGAMGGTIDLHGELRLSWTRLSATAPKGATQIVLDKAVDWKVGDKLVIASTDFENDQAEEITITAVSGSSVTFTPTLKYEHWGTLQTFNNQMVDERAEVGLLTRNIVVQGDAGSSTNGFGGHVMIMAGSKAYIENAEFTLLGQKAKIGRYPIHWHMVGDASGDYAKNNSIHHNFNRCLTLHGTHKVQVQSNVAFDTLGHCYFLEDGIETKNVFESNLGLSTRKASDADAILPTDKNPSTYWITNPDNIWRNNVAAGSDNHGFWFAFPEHPLGLSTTATIWPRRTPLGEFSGNVAHSNNSHGVFVDSGPKPDGNTETTVYNPRQLPAVESPAVTAEFKNLTAYKNRFRAIWTRGGPVVLSDFKLADNATGVNFASSNTGGGYFRDSLVVGETANKGTPYSWETKGLDGRSLPQPWSVTTSLLGFEFYDGQSVAQRVTFVNFQTNSQRPAGALAYLEKNDFHHNPDNYAEALKFINANKVYLRAPAPNKDGDVSAMFIDKDGLVTGTAGNIVTAGNFFLSTSACSFVTEWNAYNCPASHYGQLNVQNRDTNPTSLNPLTIWREEDGATQTLSGCCDDDLPTSAYTSLITNKNYMLRFPGSLPQKLRLILRFSQGRWVKVTLAYPSSSFKVLRFSNAITPQTSLTALDASPNSAYFYDSQSSKLYLKIAASSSYEEINIESGAALPTPGNYFHPLPPGRLYDSRSTATGVPLGGDGAIKSGEIRTLKAAGYVGIPTGAQAILANVTTANAVAGGYVTLFPANITNSDTAAVNWYNGGARVVGNFVIIGLSSSGEFKIKGGGSTDIIIDITGYLDNTVTGGGIFKPLTPGINPRLYDSRAGGSGLLGSNTGALTLNQPARTFPVSGTASPQAIPGTAVALVANVTAVGTKSGGFFTLYPGGANVPNVTSINWNAQNSGANVPRDIGNLTIVPIGQNGQLSMIAGGAPGSDAGAEVVIDVLGYIDSNTASPTLFNPLYTPLRLYDSRSTVSDNFAGSFIKEVLTGGATRSIKVGGMLSVPSNAKSVIVRITTVDVSGGGNLAMYPGSVYPGNASVNTNGAAQQIGNWAVVALENGSFNVKNPGNNSMGFVLDVVGYIL